jgi:hypothetical protein
VGSQKRPSFSYDWFSDPRALGWPVSEWSRRFGTE